MDQPQYHIIHTDAGPEKIYGTLRDISLLQDVREARRAHFSIAEQLDLLYKDIEAGRFGDAARQGGFACYVREIKKQFPKPEVSGYPLNI